MHCELIFSSTHIKNFWKLLSEKNNTKLLKTPIISKKFNPNLFLVIDIWLFISILFLSEIFHQCFFGKNITPTRKITTDNIFHEF